MRATKFGGAWRFQAKYADEERWTYYETPELDDLTELREIVARKYQRRRASAEDVASLDKLLRDRSHSG